MIGLIERAIREWLEGKYTRALARIARTDRTGFYIRSRGRDRGMKGIRHTPNSLHFFRFLKK